MTMNGANPDELTALGNKLTAQVDVIATLIGDVNGVLASTTWQGPARDRSRPQAPIRRSLRARFRPR